MDVPVFHLTLSRKRPFVSWMWEPPTPMRTDVFQRLRWHKCLLVFFFIVILGLFCNDSSK